MEQFLRQLQTIPEAAELIRRVEEGGCPAAVSGLQPVQRACVGAAVAAACGRPAVFLCGDEREVQVLSADLETLTGRRPVTLLGREWQFRPGAVGSRDWERSRLAALYALAQGDAPVVVATADGLMARTLPPETLRSLAITLEVGGQAELGALAEQLLSAGYTRCEQVEGVGIGVPGPVLDSSVVPIVCANLGGWGQRNVAAQLSGLLDGLKVLVGNDANVAALGEIWMGAAKGCRSAVMVTLGTGVGGGVIVNGKVIDGTHGAGGEIGHITVNRHETATCGCGKHGCLEQYSSATGVVRCMKKLLDENPDILCTLRGIDFAAKDVFDAARSGDALAAREVDEMTDTLGMALASIAATTDPEMFMIGGGVARAGEVLFDPLREHYKTYAFKSCRETPIVAATLGNDAGIYGSVRLIVGE